MVRFNIDTMFSPEIRYKDLDGADLIEMISAFKERMECYFFRPISLEQADSKGPQGFMEVAIARIIIESLAGFLKGATRENPVKNLKTCLKNWIHFSAMKFL